MLRFKGWLRKLIDVTVIAVALFVLGVVCMFIGLIANDDLSVTGFAQEFLPNLSTELVGIAVTVLVIDRLYALRQAAQEKERSLNQMASTSNDFALEGARLVKNNGWHIDGSLVGAHFNHANLQGVNLPWSNLSNVQLWLANLSKAELNGTDLHGAFMCNANLDEAILNGADLRDANLTYATLSKASLDGAKLNGTILAHADLSGARLEYADLSGARLEDAEYDGYTTWPQDFDPKAAGATNRTWLIA